MSLTLLQAAAAKLEGKRVEIKLHGPWVEWTGEEWHETWEVRIAPEPKKKVMYCLWGDRTQFGAGNVYFGKADSVGMAKNWTRIPGTDVEVEVEA